MGEVRENSWLRSLMGAKNRRRKSFGERYENAG
jgi:hypothetical protein